MFKWRLDRTKCTAGDRLQKISDTTWMITLKPPWWSSRFTNAFATSMSENHVLIKHSLREPQFLLSCFTFLGREKAQNSLCEYIRFFFIARYKSSLAARFLDWWTRFAMKYEPYELQCSPTQLKLGVCLWCKYTFVQCNSRGKWQKSAIGMIKNTPLGVNVDNPGGRNATTNNLLRIRIAPGTLVQLDNTSDHNRIRYLIC